MGTDFTGIAAADDLDRLLSAGDFEPATDVDTVTLDAMPDAIEAARTVLDRLTALQEHLTAGRDADEAEGLKVDVAVAVETLAAITAASVA